MLRLVTWWWNSPWGVPILFGAVGAVITGWVLFL